MIVRVFECKNITGKKVEGSLLSNEKHTTNMRTTKLIMIAVNNSMSFKQQFDTELWILLHVYSMNMLRSLWIYYMKTSHLSIVQWRFAFTILCIIRVYCNFRIWIHIVMWLGKRDNDYKVQSHCLMYMLYWAA